MTASLISQIEQIMRACALDPAPRLLVIGDASASICRSLTELGHHVECCTDLQSTANAHHVNARFEDLEALMHDGGQWDMTVLVEGFRRVQNVHTPEHLSRVLTWLGGHSTVTLVEAPRNALAPDLHDLGPYLVRSLLAGFSFVTELSESTALPARSRPLLVASNAGLLLDDDWIDANGLEKLGRANTGLPSAVSTYRHQDRVIKVEKASRDYFERCEASTEALFLSTVDPEIHDALSLPGLLSWHQGRAVSTVVREWVPGSPVAPGTCRHDGLPITSLIDFCAAWAAEGLFHNDLRPWNLLWTGSSFTAVDFGDAATEDRDVQEIPQILALAGTIAGLLTEDLPWGSRFHEALMSLSDREGISTRWPLSAQRGEPWLSLPGQKDRLTLALSEMQPSGPGDIVRVVIETLMTGHHGLQHG